MLLARQRPRPLFRSSWLPPCCFPVRDCDGDHQPLFRIETSDHSHCSGREQRRQPLFQSRQLPQPLFQLRQRPQPLFHSRTTATAAVPVEDCDGDRGRRLVETATATTATVPVRRQRQRRPQMLFQSGYDSDQPLFHSRQQPQPVPVETTIQPLFQLRDGDTVTFRRDGSRGRCSS